MICRYIMRLYFGAVAVVLTCLVAVLVVIKLVEDVDHISGAAGSEAWTSVRIALFAAVGFVYRFMPVACLLALLAVGAILARSGELLGFHVTGSGSGRLTKAVLLVTALLGALTAVIGEWGVPQSKARLDRIQRQELGDHLDELNSFFTQRVEWYRDGDLVLLLPEVDASREVFSGPTVFRLKNGLIHDVIEGSSLHYHATSGWVLEDVLQHGIEPATMPSSSNMSINLPASFRNFADIAGDPRYLSSLANLALIQRRTDAGLDTVAHRLALFSRWLHPLLPLWLVMMALPWAFNPNRDRSISGSLGLGVVGTAGILVIDRLFHAMVLSRYIVVPVGALGVHLVCLGALPINMWLYRRYHS
ncbi:MAG: LptF/LptG family permease [Myxococcota bacterium]